MRRGRYERKPSAAKRMRPLTRSIIAIVLCLMLPMTILAAEYDLTVGDVTINANQDGQFVTQTNGVTNQRDDAPVITSNGAETANTIVVNATSGADASVTLENVNVNTYADNYNYEAGMTVNSADGTTVTVNIEGTNTLTGENGHAGLQLNGNGDLVIAGDGSLTANGGPGGAGIGGGCDNDGVYGSGSNITITSGTITANGGYSAAGIGGASQSSTDTTNIQITGGTVIANGGECGAGIGGGYGSSGTDIEISGGTVTATGGVETGYLDYEFTGYAAGIGGGYNGDGNNITISGGSVTVTGGDWSAGIGGGCYGNADNITISGGTVTATGGYTGAAIGGGYTGDGSNITVSGNANVTATTDEYANAFGGGYGKEAVEPDVSKLTPSGSVNGVAGTYVPASPTPAPAPVPPVEEEEEEESAPIEEIKPVETPVVKVTEEKQSVKVQGEEVEVTLNASTVKVEMGEIVKTNENKAAPSVEVVISVAPEAVADSSTETVVAALKELVKDIRVEHKAEEKASDVAASEYKLDVNKDGKITLTLSDKLMEKLGKGIHEFVITIGGMEIVFTIEIL